MCDKGMNLLIMLYVMICTVFSRSTSQENALRTHFAMICGKYLPTDLPKSFRITFDALGQWYDCCSTYGATLKNTEK